MFRSKRLQAKTKSQNYGRHVLFLTGLYSGKPPTQISTWISALIIDPPQQHGPASHLHAFFMPWYLPQGNAVGGT